jgi:N-acetylglutamate synthase-like GNAT family acetyltransferase
MIPYLIREPKGSELYDALLVLYRSFGRLVPSDIEAQVKLLNNLINSKIAKFLIAEKNKKIFGLGAVFIFQEVCSLGYLSVLPEFRHNGVGSAIFSKLINAAKKVGCKTFLLYASRLGEPIYHKFGFRSNYSTVVHDLPSKLQSIQILNDNVKLITKMPEWVARLDRVAMGFNRSNFIKIKMGHGSKLIVFAEEGFALISGLRIGPIIAKNLSVAVDLINKGISLGANHIIVPKHTKFPNRIFDLIDSNERVDEVNLKMIYGKNILQKLDYIYALGTYAKG